MNNYFQLSEFECKCSNYNCSGKAPNLKMSQSLLDALNNIREQFKEPITVTSGFRCKDHNAAVGGAKASQHLLGTAADIMPSKNDLGDLDRLYQLVDAEPLVKGLGDGRKKGFIHIDARSGKKKHFNY